MNPFDLYLQQTRDFSKDLEKKGRRVRVWFDDPLGGGGVTPSQAASPLILKENTAVELGGPQTAGSTFMIWTKDVSLISDGQIMLVGPDLSEVDGETLPFGQVTLVGGPAISTEIQSRLEREHYAAEHIPGYMVRSTGGRIWSRVSFQALDDGLSLRSVGAAIIAHLREKLPAVTAAEIIFITSSTDDVQNLERIGAQVRKLSHDLRRERLRETADGQYICENEISCEACTDNDVCSDIREILVIRKKVNQSTSMS
jgi:CO dehydrogenase/acetyl-CoA synthase beta subunit